MNNIHKHIQYVIQENRRLSLVNEAEASTSKSKKKYGKPKFEKLEDIDLLDSSELPTIDISSGLKQIEEQKNQQAQLLDVIERQVQQMQGLAKDYNDELQVQSKMLNKMERDVSKYQASLIGLNQRLKTAVKSAGGSCRLFCCAIGFFVLMMCFAAAYFAIQTLVTGR